MISKLSAVINAVLSFVLRKKVELAKEFVYLKSYRSWSDGVDFFRATFELNLQGDHTPMLNLFIGMFNYTIIEFGIYNIYHEEDDDDWEDAPYKVEPIDRMV